MRRCFVLFLPSLFIGIVTHAQLVNNGATITVQSGATIKCTGAIINNSGGIIQNAGTVSADGDLRNENGGTLNGTTGIYEATTRFINKGTFTGTVNLKLIGNVNTDSILSGGASFVNVNVAKGAGNTATLSDAMTVTGIFSFDNDNNQVILADKILTMGPTATFASADANEFVVTNSTGTVTKQGLASTAFTYEVGYAAGQYNPLTMSNSGTTNDISVRCLQNVLANGTSGAPVASHFADNSWVVSASGSGYNLQMTNATWAASDELAKFNRAKTGIARYNTGTDWDLPASNVVAASGAGPYTRSRSNIQSVGVFAIADFAQVNVAKLNLKVFLQGPYNNVAGTMTDGLRSLNLIPTTQPYSSAMGAAFTRIGVYDGTASVNETVPNSSVFDVAGTSSDIVDWVYISSLDPITPATKLQTRAALIQRGGNIVEYDTLTATYGPVRMPIDADGNYHIMISHRNHLAIRTSSAPLLQDNVTMSLYDFTASQAAAYQDPAIVSNPAMKNFTSGAFGMWGGNVNSNLNTTVNYTGLNNDALAILGALGGNQGLNLTNVYSNADVNLTGNINYTGLNNDALFLLGVLGGNQAAIVRQHL